MHREMYVADDFVGRLAQSDTSTIGIRVHDSTTSANLCSLHETTSLHSQSFKGVFLPRPTPPPPPNFFVNPRVAHGDHSRSPPALKR